MIEDKSIVKVGMADLNIAQLPGVIRTTGLGSCVGLTMYDPQLKLAGMAHVMLPSSDIAREGKLNTAKYADTALPELLEKMLKMGASQSRIVSKMAGVHRCLHFRVLAIRCVLDHAMPIHAEKCWNNSKFLYWRKIQEEITVALSK